MKGFLSEVYPYYPILFFLMEHEIRTNNSAYDFKLLHILFFITLGLNILKIKQDKVFEGPLKPILFKIKSTIIINPH